MRVTCPLRAVVLFVTMFALVIILAVTACAHAEFRILGGVNTTIEEFPHQVALEYDKLFWCGGAILSSKHILTAAHCIQGMKILGFLKIRVGSTYRRKEGRLYDVQALKQFSGYSKETQNGDVGIIILSEPITFGENALPISIIPEGVETKHGEMLTVSGWGKTGYSTGIIPSVLQAVRLPCIRRQMCGKVFTDNTEFQVTDMMLCAGGGLNKGSYRGDSGGALINAKRQVVGIVSWGMTGDTSGYPRVYTNVAHPVINKFIIETIESTA